MRVLLGADEERLHPASTPPPGEEEKEEKEEEEEEEEGLSLEEEGSRD